MKKNFVSVKNFSYAQALREIGVSYLGGTSTSMKTRLSEENGTLTYIIYLAPADLSGYNVCPCSKWCKRFCLNGSGHSKIDILSGKNNIQKARIKKAIAFFENKNAFMFALIHEIKKAMKKAEKLGLNFAIRLNGTSDLSPEDFVYNGKNILEIFPDVQFYDYTKVPARLSLLNKYENYDLTFSFDGHNWKSAEKFLQNGGKVAVVFAGHNLPVSYKDYQVVNGNNYDMRFLDPAQSIIGLSYHPVAADYVKIDGKNVFVEPKTDFVVRSDNRNCVFA